MKHLIALAVITLSTMLNTSSGALGENWVDQVDMTRADLTPFSMVLINKGEAAGSMAYGWRREGEAYIIEDRTEMTPNILETAKAVIDATTLMARSVDIDFAVGPNRTVFDFKWSGTSLSGNVTINQEGKDQRVVPIASELSAIPRMAVFGVICALPLSEGYHVELPWFNTMANKLETVQIVHTGFETITTPAGTFDTHKINLKGGSPENILYITVAKPQKIVRIDVIGQPLHFERNPAP